MDEFDKICFVCKNKITENNWQLNSEVNLPVCNQCKDTTKEQKTVEVYLDELADGLICGCI